MTARERVEQVYEAERDHIYSYLLYFGLPAARAQELAQDAFLKLVPGGAQPCCALA